MSDHELNLSIHTEVEKWQWVAQPGHYQCWARPWKKDIGLEQSSSPQVPDYCNDQERCFRFMVDHQLTVNCEHDLTIVSHATVTLAKDKSLTRAVALAVLALTRGQRSNRGTPHEV